MSQLVITEEHVAQTDIEDVICSLCVKPKNPVLFAPSELKRKSPRCRLCMGNRRGSNV
jgi:hypothetical protein